MEFGLVITLTYEVLVNGEVTKLSTKTRKSRGLHYFRYSWQSVQDQPPTGAFFTPKSFKRKVEEFEIKLTQTPPFSSRHRT